MDPLPRSGNPCSDWARACLLGDQFAVRLASWPSPFWRPSESRVGLTAAGDGTPASVCETVALLSSSLLFFLVASRGFLCHGLYPPPRASHRKRREIGVMAAMRPMRAGTPAPDHLDPLVRVEVKTFCHLWHSHLLLYILTKNDHKVNSAT